MEADSRREDIHRLGAFLMTVCLFSALALAFTYQVTAPRIEENRAEMERAALQRVIPGAASFEETRIDNGVAAVENIYSGLRDGVTVGHAIRAVSPGYAGDVVVMVGIQERAITTVEVLEQTETPGLGARITEADFLDGFSGLPADSTAVDGVIDSIAGATVSTDAVVEAVGHALKAHENMGEER